MRDRTKCHLRRLHYGQSYNICAVWSEVRLEPRDELGAWCSKTAEGYKQRDIQREFLSKVLSPATSILAFPFWVRETYIFPKYKLFLYLIHAKKKCVFPSAVSPELTFFFFFPLWLFLFGGWATCPPLGPKGLSQHLSSIIYFSIIKWPVYLFF